MVSAVFEYVKQITLERIYINVDNKTSTVFW
jgi:hypothetical protein